MRSQISSLGKLMKLINLWLDQTERRHKQPISGMTGDMTPDFTHIERIIGIFYEQFYVSLKLRKNGQFPLRIQMIEGHFYYKGHYWDI